MVSGMTENAKRSFMITDCAPDNHPVFGVPTLTEATTVRQAIHALRQGS